MTTWIEIPLPPSGNNLYFNLPKGGRARSHAYNEWLSEATTIIHFAATGRDGLGQISGEPPAKIAGPYALHMQAGKPDKRKRDLGNLWKSLEDALKKGGLIEDDSLCQSQYGEWVSGVEGLRVLVLPTKERT
jgi:Holliday junction resolvase RusA-like endonuclease